MLNRGEILKKQGLDLAPDTLDDWSLRRCFVELNFLWKNGSPHIEAMKALEPEARKDYFRNTMRGAIKACGGLAMEGFDRRYPEAEFVSETELTELQSLLWDFGVL